MFLHTIPENELVTPVLDVFDRKILHNQQVGLYVLFDSFCTNVFGKEGDNPLLALHFRERDGPGYVCMKETSSAKTRK